MTMRMTATEVKAEILALLDQVSSGDEVEITKHGRLVARLAAGGPRLLAVPSTRVADVTRRAPLRSEISE